MSTHKNNSSYAEESYYDILSKMTTKHRLEQLERKVKRLEDIIDKLEVA